MKHKKMDLGNALEDIYLKNRVGLSIVVSGIITILFHLGIITNIRTSISNLIDLTAALMVIITLILTLLLYLNDKEKYIKRLEKYKAGKKQIYYLIFKIAITNIVSTCILIAIDIFKINVYSFKIVIAFVGSSFFSYMMFGTIYMLWFAIFIVIGIDSEQKKMT